MLPHGLGGEAIAQLLAHHLSMYPVQLVILAVLALLLGTLLLSLALWFWG